MCGKSLCHNDFLLIIELPKVIANLQRSYVLNCVFSRNALLHPCIGSNFKNKSFNTYVNYLWFAKAIVPRNKDIYFSGLKIRFRLTNMKLCENPIGSLIGWFNKWSKSNKFCRQGNINFPHINFQPSLAHIKHKIPRRFQYNITNKIINAT
jgi:hypothetical protein